MGAPSADAPRDSNEILIEKSIPEGAIMRKTGHVSTGYVHLVSSNNYETGLVLPESLSYPRTILLRLDV